MAGSDHDPDSLEPPRTSTEDPGAHDLESSESEDHFSDAHTGLDGSGAASPIPSTRVDKVDSEPSHGEVPGTKAYDKRTQDAAPDVIAVSSDSKENSRPITPGGLPIPTTLVEKLDTEEASYGEVPGTEAHEKRRADAVPDLVIKTSGHGHSRSLSSNPSSTTRSRAGSTPGDLPIPITRVERVDSSPSHGEVPGTVAWELRKEDAQPDIVEEVGDAPVFRSPIVSPVRRTSSAASKKASIEAGDYNEEEDGSENAFGDEFDDFEAGEEDAEFGDFDTEFDTAEAALDQPVSVAVASSDPLLDFMKLSSPEEVHQAVEPYLDTLFSPDSIDTSILPPFIAPNPIFLTPRSASLWSQLVAPPPLQPPNWIRSRIRRLFLVSLGIPVSLDEILPASKQKKLILPSTSPRDSTEGLSNTLNRLKDADNISGSSIDSQGKLSRSDSRRRKGPPPAPVLDLVAARQLCVTTDEALNGLTTEELGDHIRRLEELEGLTKEALDYWTKRTDEKLGDREAFEGVIENLVKHARKVRK